MNRVEKINACNNFFMKLMTRLEDGYEIVESCNQDISKYLIPIGTIDELTYNSKPNNSFRISDHWNWYANILKNPNERYVQCLSNDFPWPKKRKAPGKPSDPIFAIAVCVIGEDGKYHHVFGEKFDRKNKKWSWIESDVDDVLKIVF